MFRLAVIFAILAALIPTTVLAHHRGDTLPGIPTTIMKRAMDRGFVTFRFDASASVYPNFRSQVSAVAESGNFWLGIPAFETTDRPDIWLTMPDDSTFISTCGSEAAACVTYASDPGFIFFRRALGYFDWKTAIAHEGINYGHIFGEHEQYDDINFRCRSVSELLADGPGLTVMSCGTPLWEPQPFDIRTVRAVTMPQLNSGGALDLSGSKPIVWYGPSDGRTTRVAVFFENYLGDLYWTGQYAIPVPPCGDPWGICGALEVESPYIDQRCLNVYIGHENALPGSWGPKQYVGSTPCY